MILPMASYVLVWTDKAIGGVGAQFNGNVTTWATLWMLPIAVALAAVFWILPFAPATGAAPPADGAAPILEGQGEPRPE